MEKEGGCHFRAGEGGTFILLWMKQLEATGSPPGKEQSHCNWTKGAWLLGERETETTLGEFPHNVVFILQVKDHRE